MKVVSERRQMKRPTRTGRVQAVQAALIITLVLLTACSRYSYETLENIAYRLIFFRSLVYTIKNLYNRDIIKFLKGQYGPYAP